MSSCKKISSSTFLGLIQACSGPHEKKRTGPWGQFLERPGNFSGPKSHFKNHLAFYVQSFLCHQVLHLSKDYTYAAFEKRAPN